MKKNYQEPKMVSVDLGVEANYAAIQTSEGNGEFDVKRQNVWDDEED